MSDISNYVSEYAAYTNQGVNQAPAKETTRADMKRVSGKTIGNPRLSEKALKYYEELKEKYSNMDFILVSKEQKEMAKAQAASYANAEKMVVLIDEEKIERMAEDENYRKQYEGIIANSASGISQLKSRLSTTGATVKGFGMQVNDGGTASFFAVLEKSSKAQKERIEKKAQEKKEAKKAQEKKSEKEERKERLEKKRESEETDGETVTITASSIEDLIRKIDDYMQLSKSDIVQTEGEKMLGQNVDFTL
ncbi:MAG: DUF6033 family protein [Eubacteriales bacterium]|nr:DUF6033 family protein [Eubacteriales bacterium]